MRQTINFSEQQWQDVKNTYDNWWNKKAEQVVVGGIIQARAPQIDDPKIELLNQCNVHLNIPASKIVDAIEYKLSQYEFLGDAFPTFCMDCFGPGVVAAFLGCELYNDNGRHSVWFRPKQPQNIENFNPIYDKDNAVLKRIKEIYTVANDRFEGKVLFGMPDLGGVADILAAFFPGEELLLMLYDNPSEVKQALQKLTVLWHKYYEEFAADIKSNMYGYTDWSVILSPGKSSYIIQSDFSYMLSSAMFDEFIAQQLRYHCEKLDRTIFHLDGVGELKHLDSILSIEKLGGVQWIPGDGQAPCEQWQDVYDKILARDKLVQVCWSGYEGLFQIAERVDKRGYLQHPSPIYDLSQRDYAVAMLKKLKSIKSVR